MAGGPGFLRPDDELTVRLCFVNFDGAKALQESRRIGIDNPLPENFVQEACTPVYDGIQVDLRGFYPLIRGTFYIVKRSNVSDLNKDVIVLRVLTTQCVFSNFTFTHFWFVRSLFC